MIIGISSMILGDQEKILDRDEISFLAGSGLKYLELSNYHKLDERSMGFLKDSGIALYSIHADYNDCDISETNLTIRTKGMEDALSRIDIAARWGAKILVVHPGGWFDDHSEGERTLNCMESLVRICNYAEPKGIKVAVENLPMGFFGEDLETLSCILAEVRKKVNRPENIGICLDTGHAHLTENLYDILSEFKDSIFTMHLQDNNGDQNRSKKDALDDLHLPPGQGGIDWRRFFITLEDIGYRGAIIFELKGDSIKGQDKNFIMGKLREFLSREPYFRNKIR
ncbi:MAG: sugar phosphate isomerase/epimerase [Actinomycetota bacterium]|nr:sugar phosphate isomerase/epimerase [Actinomycetota bacterium]